MNPEFVVAILTVIGSLVVVFVQVQQARNDRRLTLLEARRTTFLSEFFVTMRLFSAYRDTLTADGKRDVLARFELAFARVQAQAPTATLRAILENFDATLDSLVNEVFESISPPRSKPARSHSAQVSSTSTSSAASSTTTTGSTSGSTTGSTSSPATLQTAEDYRNLASHLHGIAAQKKHTSHSFLVMEELQAAYAEGVAERLENAQSEAPAPLEHAESLERARKEELTLCLEDLVTRTVADLQEQLAEPVGASDVRLSRGAATTLAALVVLAFLGVGAYAARASLDDDDGNDTVVGVETRCVLALVEPRTEFYDEEVCAAEAARAPKAVSEYRQLLTVRTQGGDTYDVSVDPQTEVKLGDPWPR